jgi:excinuclease ABC subunit C
MKEVVYRRYYRLLMEDSKMPDLIVIDGGEIQVHACLDVIKSLNLDIPVLGIQKDDHHKATILFFNEKLINIDKNSAIYLLLADISQRVHDFAISFFRSEKAKGFFASYLDGISGLGKKRKETLIKHFITVDNIKNAKIDEIRSLGIPEDVAVKIHTKLNENN